MSNSLEASKKVNKDKVNNNVNKESMNKKNRLEVIDENKNSKLNKAQNQNKFIKLDQSDKDDDNL
jgi:hypothetical protein